MCIAVLAEKPAVARDLAAVLGAKERGNGFFRGNGYIVTWAIGHLVTLSEPHKIDSRWKAWRKEDLPMLPRPWRLSILKKTRPQFETVKQIFLSKEVKSLVAATDAGREGELIFRYIYKASGSTKPFQRLWISSLTPDAIKAGFNKLKDGKEYDPLADAAIGRSKADWLVGLNFSRVYTVVHKETFSVGRVQTPTLAMLVEREQAIQNFTPEQYVEIVGTFSPETAEEKKSSPFQGIWFESRPPSDPNPKAFSEKKSSPKRSRLPADKTLATKIVERCRNQKGSLESISSKTKTQLPPLLYDLTELQRHANRAYGFSAKKTLDIAQKLYEEKKIITYPRTDCRYLSHEISGKIGEVVSVIMGPYQSLLPFTEPPQALPKRYVDDAKITDHHAIIPTLVSPASVRLDQDEHLLYDLICRRLLTCFLKSTVSKTTTVVIAVDSFLPGDSSNSCTDLFKGNGASIEEVGWKVLDFQGTMKKKSKKEVQETGRTQTLPPGLRKGGALETCRLDIVQKETRPPFRFTDATLLTAMETAGKTVDDKKLSHAMKERGLGTPATRASVIETLVDRKFILRSGKTYEATQKGISLIALVHPFVKSPDMTGDWENRLKKIQKGKGSLELFIEEIEQFVTRVVKEVLTEQGVNKPALGPHSPSPISPAPRFSLKSSGGLPGLLKDAFGYSSFRPFQEQICASVVKKNDVLLVMPTGAGKSLCYQLPGIALCGTTLVISPLIALMEDQVMKLKKMGFHAERIHSGRSREASRQACIDYLQGTLDFLFIAPERLSVAGFPEMLAKKKPVLIAVDEAHCISQWGHDFRPDYRLLGERLPLLRPAPVIAMTATATVRVQQDIVSQLALENPQYHIHGFRRENLAIEMVELTPGKRSDAIAKLLQEKNLRPAIVYAPTRKKAEAIATVLKENFPAEAYHAGLRSERREQVQASFLNEETEVIVATIAFGMGIDKPNVRTVIHTAMPASIENYYQEIGRAGRDGKFSRAILYHSYGDRRMHLFFYEKNYPNEGLLKKIFSSLSDEKKFRENLLRVVSVEEEEFDTALEKLWIHGGAIVGPDDSVRAGHNKWEFTYKIQKSHRLAQVDAMQRFTGASSCRMLALIHHFGDTEDNGKVCGVCDFCASDSVIATRTRPPTSVEQKIVFGILKNLKASQSVAAGRLFSVTCEEHGVERRVFENLLDSLTKTGVIALSQDSFTKEDKTIHYKRVDLTQKGTNCSSSFFDGLKIREVEPGSKRTKSTRKSRGSFTVAPKNSPTPNIKTREALTEWRLKEAQRRRIPAFKIFSNKTLDQLASDLPSDLDSFLGIKGIGSSLADKYGNAVLEIIKKSAE
ncbi:MAG: DNA topoisomerase 3 [Nitrospinota bacterium]